MNYEIDENMTQAQARRLYQWLKNRLRNDPASWDAVVSLMADAATRAANEVAASLDSGARQE